jgi:hypothetical protein
MNNRIKKLAKDAKTLMFIRPDLDDEIMFEKFGELVIKECIQSLWTEECYVSDLAIEDFNRNQKKIKEHFGMK